MYNLLRVSLETQARRCEDLLERLALTVGSATGSSKDLKRERAMRRDVVKCGTRGVIVVDIGGLL